MKMSAASEASAPSLTLPTSILHWKRYEEFVLSETPFALYTLIDVSPNKLNELQTKINKPWMEPVDYNGGPSIRLPPSWNHASKTLLDIISAHDALNKEQYERAVVANSRELEFQPSQFFVITSPDFDSENGSLLYVYEDEDPEGLERPMGLKMFFMPTAEVPENIAGLLYMNTSGPELHYQFEPDKEMEEEQREGAKQVTGSDGGD